MSRKATSCGVDSTTNDEGVVSSGDMLAGGFMGSYGACAAAMPQNGHDSVGGDEGSNILFQCPCVGGIVSRC